MSFFEHTVLCTLTGADPAESLHAISKAGIPIMEISGIDDLTVRFRCPARYRSQILRMREKKGDTILFSHPKGWGAWINVMKKRPVLVSGAMFFLILSLYLPSRVFFFSVEGNETIPARQILEAAEDSGIRFGVSRKRLRSEKMKNTLLAEIPELKWAGINTAGCSGIISVRERMPQQKQEFSSGVSSITACRDGYITSCTVTKGNSLCAPGQVVKKGETLISGYTDCGISIRVTEAQGEIFALTGHALHVKTPAWHLGLKETVESRRRFSLIIGKKRINFWKGSGISDPTCGRMYAEYYITLPGGFRLPVCLAVETLTQRQFSPERLPPETLEQAIKHHSRQTVLGNTVAGQILQEEHILSEMEDGYVLSSRFLCEEMIGRVIKEEIGDTNGKTD